MNQMKISEIMIFKHQLKDYLYLSSLAWYFIIYIFIHNSINSKWKSEASYSSNI